MTEPMRDDELEATLVEIGQRLQYPVAAGMSTAVRARLLEPRRRRSFWTPPAFAPALVTFGVLFLVVALGSPGLRSAAEQFLHLRGIDIFRVPSVPSATPRTSSSPSVAIPGQRMTLADARRTVHFNVLQPTAPELGAPDEIVVDTSGGAERVTFVYRERPGIAPSATTGLAALVVEFRGSVDTAFFGKTVGAGTTLEELTVSGGRGFWLAGAPHFFFYRDQSGTVQQDTLRLAGNTLIWEQDGVTLRLEADVPKDTALRIASTIR